MLRGVRGLFKKTKSSKERASITVLLQNEKSKNIFIGSCVAILDLTVCSQTYDQKYAWNSVGFQNMRNDAPFGHWVYNLQFSCIHLLLWHCGICDIASHGAAFLIGSLSGEDRSWMGCHDWSDISTIKWSLINYPTAIACPVPLKLCWKILGQKYQEICFNFLYYLDFM